MSCTLKNSSSPESQLDMSSNQKISSELKSNLSKKIHNYFKECNSLENPFEFDEHSSPINSQYISVDEFNEISNQLGSNFGVLHLNIASLNKYIEDLNNFLASLSHRIELIGITEHKIKYGNFLQGSLSNYNFVFNPITSTHGGVGIFISNSLSYKMRKDLEINFEDLTESILLKSHWKLEKIFCVVAFTDTQVHQ